VTLLIIVIIIFYCFFSDLLIIVTIIFYCFFSDPTDDKTSVMKGLGVLSSGVKANALLGSSEESDILKSIKDDLYQVCSGSMKPDVALAKAGRDTRSRSQEYDSARGGIPGCLLALIKEAALGFETSEISAYRVEYFVGFRNTETIIKPPGPNVIARVLYNIGNKEIYHLTSGGIGVKELTDMIKNKTKAASTTGHLDDKDLLLPADSCTYLGYHDMCDYEITVSSIPPAKTPEFIQQGGQKIIKPTRFIRPPSYHRITVIVDLEGDVKVLQRLKGEITERVSKLKVGELQKVATDLTQKADAMMKDSKKDQSDMTITKKEQKEIKKLMTE
jgi:hypothetical protein